MATLTSVAPEIPVRNLTADLEYYTSRLGFEVSVVMPDRDYAIVERDAVALHLFIPKGPSPSRASIQVFAQDLEALFDELEARGAIVTQGIAPKPWGNREFRVADGAGNTIKFTEPAG